MGPILGILFNFFQGIITGVINEALKSPAETFDIDDTGGEIDFEPADDIDFLKFV